MSRMRDALAAKLALAPRTALPGALNLRGVTPVPGSGVYELQGPSQRARLALFARGLRIYQLLQQGSKLDDAAWVGFSDSVTLTP